MLFPPDWFGAIGPNDCKIANTTYDNKHRRDGWNTVAKSKA